MTICIKKGLDLSIIGAPEKILSPGNPVQQVALLAEEYKGLQAGLLVKVGERVKKGQPLLTDRGQPGVHHTAWVGGTIQAIHCGPPHTLRSLIIADIGEEELTFDYYPSHRLAQLSREAVQENLCASGLWVALRNRPFSRTPAIDTQPAALFVTAIDTRPLAADPAVVIQQDPEDFLHGLMILTRLTQGPLYLCTAPHAVIPSPPSKQVIVRTFSGPHPAGLVGTHIHHLSPVSLNRSVWHIGYQDVIAIGKLFTTGRLYSERIVALGGPSVHHPRLLRTTLGANLIELTAGELQLGENRVVSGSLLDGHTAIGDDAFLGRFHQQVSVIQEGRTRSFFGWLRAGKDKYSITRTTSSHLWPQRCLALTTAQHGDKRAMVPIGTYERVMPLDILPTLLLRSLIVGDYENAQILGCLELDEEDLALCAFVCPGKYEYGALLRTCLNQIEKEG